MLLFASSVLATELPDLSAPPPGHTRDAVGDVALIIAVESYMDLSPVTGARANAAAWDAWLTSRGATVNVLYDKQATREQILARAAAISKERSDDGRAWLVFIGHGAPARAGGGALVGYDAQASCASLDARTVAQSDLLDALGANRGVEVMAVVDACFSGTTPEGSLMRGCQPAVPLDADVPRTATVMRAAAGTQYAGALPGEDRPAFSWLALGALRGWADVDGDQAVTAAELTSWTRAQLASMPTAEVQTPEVEGRGGIVLARASEPDPNPAKILRGVAAAGGAFDGMTLDVEHRVKEQACLRDAEAKGQVARDARLATMAKAAQAEATAAWAKLGPQAEACTSLADSGDREGCARTVDSFVAEAEGLVVTLGAGTERVSTACGTREPAYAAASEKVAVPEVTRAEEVAGRLRRGTGSATTLSREPVSRSGDAPRGTVLLMAGAPALEARAGVAWGRGQSVGFGVYFSGVGLDLGPAVWVRWRFAGGGPDFTLPVGGRWAFRGRATVGFVNEVGWEGAIGVGSVYAAPSGFRLGLMMDGYYAGEAHVGLSPTLNLGWGV